MLGNITSHPIFYQFGSDLKVQTGQKYFLFLANPDSYTQIRKEEKKYIWAWNMKIDKTEQP